MSKNERFREYIYPVIILTVIALVTTALLAITNHISAPIIVANAEATANQTRAEVLPGATSFTQVTLSQEIASDDGKAHVSDAYVADDGSGCVITCVTTSFGGDLTMMVGIDKDGAITGVKVTNHSDTPGVGTKDQDPDYLAQYTGLTALTSTDVKKESSTTQSGNTFQYISGASVSGGAIHEGVYVALEAYQDLKESGSF